MSLPGHSDAVYTSQTDVALNATTTTFSESTAYMYKTREKTTEV